MLERIRDSFTPIRERGDNAVADARTRLHRVRSEVHAARARGQVALWTLQTQTLERAHDVLAHTPKPLEPVVHPIQKVVDDRYDRVTRLPIEGYDELNARSAASAVRDLDAVGLALVERHERAHKNRKTVLDAIARWQEKLLHRPNDA